MNKHKKTGYEWCVEDKIRIYDVNSWPRSFEMSGGKGYYLTGITRDEFLRYLTQCGKHKSDSTPRKSDWFLELRMYSLVPYNIKPIQQGIQHEHAVTEYNVKHVMDNENPCELYKTWAKEWKTVILLNGGTSNEGHWVRQGFREVWYEGSMELHLKTLQENDIKLAFFKEPDLNNMISGISFIVDERVFNKTLYPDFVNSPYPWNEKGRAYKPKEEEFAKWEKDNNKNYEAWCEKIGGEKNVFLRDFLKPSNFRLA